MFNKNRDPYVIIRTAIVIISIFLYELSERNRGLALPRGSAGGSTGVYFGVTKNVGLLTTTFRQSVSTVVGMSTTFWRNKYNFENGLWKKKCLWTSDLNRPSFNYGLPGRDFFRSDKAALMLIPIYYVYFLF